ncbi:hypothetical protein BHM03_00060846 [Ensete ventricosum]|nr:hypothetical protein BHM03_00060846 [Ensete ventricosum]
MMLPLRFPNSGIRVKRTQRGEAASHDQAFGRTRSPAGMAGAYWCRQRPQGWRLQAQHPQELPLEGQRRLLQRRPPVGKVATG